jgi:hypothetical protein
MNTSEHDLLMERIRAEYLEMPGMALRLEQVARLCGVDRSICKLVLDALVDAKFLCLTDDGTYVPLRPDTTLRARPVKATVESSVHRACISAPVESCSMGMLNWSKRGDVACDVHSPDPALEQWKREGWCAIPPSVDGRHGRWFQCPSCDPLHRRYRALTRSGSRGKQDDVEGRDHSYDDVDRRFHASGAR